MQRRSTGKTMWYAVLVLSGLASAGCQKLGTGDQTLRAIPAAHGDLVGVTQGDGAHQAVLWFKQPDGTIVAVREYVPRGTTRYPRN